MNCWSPCTTQASEPPGISTPWSSVAQGATPWCTKAMVATVGSLGLVRLWTVLTGTPYSLCHVITSCLVFCCRCCKMHDWCYTTTSCMILQYNLPYFVPYKWKCNGGAPYCGQYLCLCYILTGIHFSVAGKTSSSSGGSCSHQVGSCAICHLPHLMIHILTHAAVWVWQTVCTVSVWLSMS